MVITEEDKAMAKILIPEKIIFSGIAEDGNMILVAKAGDIVGFIGLVQEIAEDHYIVKVRKRDVTPKAGIVEREKAKE